MILCTFIEILKNQWHFVNLYKYQNINSKLWLTTTELTFFLTISLFTHFYSCNASNQIPIFSIVLTRHTVYHRDVLKDLKYDATLAVLWMVSGGLRWIKNLTANNWAKRNDLPIFHLTEMEIFLQLKLNF